MLEVIHVPAFRGNPERTYERTAVADRFPGTFEHYVASVIGHWQAVQDGEKLKILDETLQELVLTAGVVARRLDDARFELLVGRLRPRVAGRF